MPGHNQCSLSCETIGSGDGTAQGPQITCPLPTSGTCEVSLFIGDEQYSDFGYVGQIEFNQR